MRITAWPGCDMADGLSVILQSPVGAIRITGRVNLLTSISFHGGDVKPSSGADTQPAIRAAEKFLDDYFRDPSAADPGPCISYLDMSPFSSAGRDILMSLITVPPGHVITYGDLAARAGHPRAARFAGNMMSRNPFAILVPCHRVIPASGGIGNYGGGVHIKEWLLRHEGYAGIKTAGEERPG